MKEEKKNETSKCKKKLNRNTQQRKALQRSLICSLATHKIIKTTLSRAKFLRPIFEKIVTVAKNSTQTNRDSSLSDTGNNHTVAKNNTLTNRRRLLSDTGNNHTVCNILLNDIGPMVKDRPGGYTKIVKAGNRSGDCAPMAYIMLVDHEIKDKIIEEEENSGNDLSMKEQTSLPSA